MSKLAFTTLKIGTDVVVQLGGMQIRVGKIKGVRTTESLSKATKDPVEAVVTVDYAVEFDQPLHGGSDWYPSTAVHTSIRDMAFLKPFMTPVLPIDWVGKRGAHHGTATQNDKHFEFSITQLASFADDMQRGPQ